MSWQVHTGPFPFVVPGHENELWLWRITDGVHFTSVTVNISAALRRIEPSRLPDETWKAIESRGRHAVEKCLGWHEPPREISFRDGKKFPAYWGGTK